MFTYPTLLISYVCTVLYAIYCILACATLSLLIHIFIYSYSIPFLIPLGICCGIVRYYLLDIAALSELEARVFRYTRNNIC